MMRPRMADRNPRLNSSRGSAPNEKAFVRAEEVRADNVHESTDLREAVAILKRLDANPVARIIGKILENNPGVEGPQEVEIQLFIVPLHAARLAQRAD